LKRRATIIVGKGESCNFWLWGPPREEAVGTEEEVTLSVQGIREKHEKKQYRRRVEENANKNEKNAPPLGQKGTTIVNLVQGGRLQTPLVTRTTSEKKERALRRK